MPNSADRYVQQKCSSLPRFFSLVGEITGEQPQANRGAVLLWRGQGNSQWNLEPGLQVHWKQFPDQIQAVEQSMFQDFGTAAPYLLPTAPPTDWDRLSLAQHYGMRTRLLDWTVNPAVALWFAVAEPLAVDAAVWAFRPSDTNMKERTRRSSPFEVMSTAAFRPVLHSSRVAAQAGWHTVHKFQKGRGLMAIDLMTSHHAHLTKIVIPRAKRDSILSALEGIGISVTTVFGDLSTLCSYISTRYRPI